MAYYKNTTLEICNKQVPHCRCPISDLQRSLLDQTSPKLKAVPAVEFIFELKLAWLCLPLLPSVFSIFFFSVVLVWRSRTVQMLYKTFFMELSWALLIIQVESVLRAFWGLMSLKCTQKGSFAHRYSSEYIKTGWTVDGLTCSWNFIC